YVVWRIDVDKHRDDQDVQIGIANHDLRVTGTTNHARVSLTNRNHVRALLQFMRAAAGLVGRPFAQAVDAIGEAPVLLFRMSVAVETAKIRTRLDQRGDAARQPVTFRVT